MWGVRSTPPHPSQDLPAALLHLRDRYFRGNVTPSISSRAIRTLAVRGTRAGAQITAGMAWDIVDPIFYVGYPWLSPFGYGLPFGLPYGDDQDEGGGAQVAPQQADYSNQPPGDYGPEPRK